MTPTPAPPATHLTARTPEDLLAMVPVVLGFQPQESVVLLTFGSPRPFHARIDLPASAAEDEPTVEALLAPAVHHGVRRAAVIVFVAEPRAGVGRRLGRRLVRAFQSAGVDVVEALRSDGSRWHPLVSQRPGVPARGVPYDLSCHPFTAQAVLDGRAMLGSRDELARLLDPDPAGVAAVAACLDRAPGPVDAGGVADLVARHLGATRLADPELAGLLLAVRDPAVRDGAWTPVRRPQAREHVELWTDAVRRAPAQVRGSAAAVLAMVAWIAGDGALAWCAIDRCVEVDPANSLARLVGDALQQAVPPDAIEGLGAAPDGC